MQCFCCIVEIATKKIFSLSRFYLLFCFVFFCILLMTLIRMAKHQRTMRDMLFRAESNRKIVTVEVAAGSTSSTPSEPPTELNDIQKANVD